MVIYRSQLVRDVTCAIWCSHKGMTEAELQEYIDVRTLSSRHSCSCFQYVRK